MEVQFVHPGEVAPIGLGAMSPAHQPGRSRGNARSGRPDRIGRTDRIGRASSARRISRMRRLLPVAIAAAAAVVFATLTDGGSNARQAAPITSYLSHALEKVGLGLSEVTVKGQSMTTDGEIYDRLQLGGRHSIWLFDTEVARKRVESLPWVLRASLKRVFPDRLQIDIQERIPRALWSDGRRTALIDATGRVLGPPVKGRFANLPTIFGAGAAPHADAILVAVSRIPVLRGRVGVYEWTANRRWTLHLKSGRQILLPAAGQSLALVQLTRGGPGRRLLDSNFEKLDLRVASQAVLDLRLGVPE